MVHDSEISIEQAPRVCFFAHYHHLGLAAGHTLYYLDALRSAGFTVVVVSTAVMEEVQVTLLRQHCSALILRDNVGLDFGGWIECLARYPDLTAEYLLLANDSVYAPVTDLGAFIDRLTSVPADFYGAVESNEIKPHFQSWFLLLRPSAYRSEAFRQQFSTAIDPSMSKSEIITNYEVELKETLTASGLRGHATPNTNQIGHFGTKWPLNPMHLPWRHLLAYDTVPFIKIELTRLNPLYIRDVSDVIDYVRRINPVLASLIVEDQRMRPPAATLSARAAWIQSLPGRSPVAWVELQGFMRRDLGGLTGWRKLVNTSLFFAILPLAKIARHLVRKALTARQYRLDNRVSKYLES